MDNLGMEVDFSYLETLLEIVRKHDKSVTENDFYNPEPSFIIGTLLAIFEHIGMDITNIITPQSQSITIFESSMAPHTNTVKMLNVILVTKCLLAWIGYFDFCFSDIIRPRQPKISEILKTLLNFVSHKEKMEDIVCTKLKEMIEIEEKSHALEEENIKLDELISIKRLEVDEMKKNKNEKIKIKNEIDNKLQHVKNDTELKENELEELKKQFNDLTKKLSDIKNENNDIQTEINVLSNNIVHSPKRIIEDAEKCQQNLTYWTDQLKNHKLKLEQNESLKNECLKSLNYLETCNSLSESIINEIDKLKILTNDIKLLTQTNIDISSNTNNLKLEIQYYSEQLDIKHLATRKLVENVEKKREDAKKRLDHISRTKEESIEEIKQLQNEIKIETEKRKQLQNEIESFNIDNDNDISRYNMLCQILSSLHTLENLLIS